MVITPERVRQVDDEGSLFEFLREELGWPVADEPDTYAFDAEELGLTGETAGQIGTVRQIAPFAPGQPWGVFLVTFAGDRVYQGALRRVLRGLSESRRDRDASVPAWQAANLLFICTPNFRDFTFARFDGRSHTRATLSLFGWDTHGGGLRTLCEYNLPALRFPPAGTDAEGWLRRWAEAFDVEAVTKKFYGEYEDVFNRVETLIEGISGDKRLFTQRLFNRLMFIQFLSKKRWLRFGNDAGGPDYLRALWAGRDRSVSFYTAHLCPLFFAALNNPHIHRDLGIDGVLRSRIGHVPYLNGGLFYKSEDEVCGEIVPDEAFDLIINRLFARFNFTVHESTPLDIEVAVDPEMLGKVFEELVTDRHGSGSYYTPRPVVAFMCREALKGYLGGFDALVDQHDASGVSVPQARELLRRLAEVKVVDPACGSGAYLLGMLQELFALNRILDTRAEQPSARGDYKRKLDIVRNNIYGVDLDDFAVQIARLRLWLSLAVEYDGEVPEPLPNLDFKVEQGDSLSAPDPQYGLKADMFRQKDIEEFSVKKAQYADPYFPGDKKKLRNEIKALRDGIAAWTHPKEAGKVQGFDWRVEFAEVFETQEPLADLGGAMNFGDTLSEPAHAGGFDIVLANPPYVRQELIKDQKPTLAKVYPEVYIGTADLYCYFYARALQLLAPDGMVAFISPNKWFRAGYGAKLRKHIAETCRVSSITDFGELPLFQAAATFPMIFVAQRATASDSERQRATVFTQVKSLGSPYPDVLSLIQQDGSRLPASALNGSDWTLTDTASADRLRKMTKAGLPLGEYVKSSIYSGIKSGYNAAFLISGDTKSRLLDKHLSSAEIIKPFGRGDDVRRWVIRDNDQYLIYTPPGTDINMYPAVKNYLIQFRPKLEARAVQQPWWELQQAQNRVGVWPSFKIVFPDISKEPRFAFDTTGKYMDMTAFTMVVKDHYLLGVLNSSSAWEFLGRIAAVLGDADNGGRMRLKRQYVERIPIPDASDTDKATVAALVQKCLDAKGVGCEAWETEINERVAALYGL